MSTTEEVYKTSNVSTQVTKITSFSTKLEWRIENFEKVIRLYSYDQSISSKTFTLPHHQAVWQLDLSPRGERGNQTSYMFHLRLIGFQASDGSLSADGPKSITADYEIYLLSSTNVKNLRQRRFFKFEIGTAATAFQDAHCFMQCIHPDGSLLVICEIGCKASEETLAIESPLNPDLLDAIILKRLSNNFKEMWKSQLFTDCTLEVGANSFPAHKCILGQWSEVFRKMFSLPTEEAKNGIVEITDFSPEPISAMLEYMYTAVVKKEVMDTHSFELLTLADKYAVIPLKDTCEVFIASKLTTTNLLEVAMFADRYSAAKLKKACVNRFAIDGRAILESKEWEDLKIKNKDFANELLELLIKDHPCFADVQEKTGNETFETLPK
ncbi:BTB/POZ domain-containing protein [Ditylenchus destructor]|nr:BTB/POZ domain-containing protein [Ditylenchus destructor]